MVTDIIKETVSNLTPEMPQNLKWRLTVSAVCIMSVYHVLHACGWLSVIGMSGFASASDVNAVLLEIKETKILDRQRDFCHAPVGSKQKTFYLSRRNKLLAEYRDIKGESYEGLPDCDEL